MQRNILRITWTKDPAAAPFPGVYVAVDIAAHFGNVDRHCGYVVLYQRPSGGEFEIMREESNFIDNATAEAIERQQSRAVLDRSWEIGRELSQLRSDSVSPIAALNGGLPSKFTSARSASSFGPLAARGR